MDFEIFKDHSDYWNVAKNIRDIYTSEGTLLNLLDFDLYAFKNWILGELVTGPDIGKYKITCTFMWPEKLMPDPRGARRLLPFDCDVKFKKTTIQIPIKIENPSDYRPGTHKAKLIPKKVWLVQITMPKSLISEIRTGSIELEDQDIDLQELDDAYDKDLDKDQYQSQSQASAQQQAMPGAAPPISPAAPTPGAPA